MTDWVDVSDVSPVASYTATASQTVFTVPFVFFAEADLEVYINGTLKTLTTDYTTSGVLNEAGGSVTLVVGATLGDSVVIQRVLAFELTTHVPTSGQLDVPAINLQFSRMMALLQQMDSAVESAGLGASSFKTIRVAGQNDVVADVASDVLTVAAGSNVVLTTSDTTDTVTIAVPSAGAIGFLSKVTASSSASIAFTTELTATYTSYRFILENVVPATNTATFRMTVSTDAGANYQATSYVNAGGGSTAAISLTVEQGVSSTAGLGISCIVDFHNPAGTAAKKLAYANGLYNGSAGGGTITQLSSYGGYWNGANTAINAVKFLFSTGNIASGTIYIYGIKGA